MTEAQEDRLAGFEASIKAANARECTWSFCQQDMEWAISLIREQAAELDTLNAQGNGHEKPCYYCGKPCDKLAGNPSEWPIPLCHLDEPGKVKYHHIGCVSERLAEITKRDERIARAIKEPDYTNLESIIAILKGEEK